MSAVETVIVRLRGGEHVVVDIERFPELAAEAGRVALLVVREEQERRRLERPDPRETL